MLQLGSIIPNTTAEQIKNPVTSPNSKAKLIPANPTNRVNTTRQIKKADVNFIIIIFK